MAKVGKFRGAEFFVEESRRQIGRQNILHEFTGNDAASGEDRRRRTRRFTFQGLLASYWSGSSPVKEKYETALKKLVDALEEPGPGKLVHPFTGASHQVQVDGPIEITESTQQGGIARVSVTFVEVGQQMPMVTLDLPGEVRKIAVRVPSLMTLAELDLSGPDFLTTAVRAILSGPRGLTNAITKVNNGIASKFALIDEVSGAIDAFGSALTTLLNTPDALALAIQNLVNSVLTAVTSAENALSRGDKQRDLSRTAAVMAYVSALGTFGDSQPEVTGTTATREIERVNRAQLVDTVEAAALAGGIDKLLDIPLDNTDQATDVLDTLGGLFDRLQGRGTIGDDVSQALKDLRASHHRFVRRSAFDLTGLGKYTPPNTIPALVLSHRLYGTSAYDQLLIERNGISHPGFVPGSVEIAVPSV